MEILNLISISLFILFITLYLFKLALLYKVNKIKANVLAKGNKDIKIKRIENKVRISTFLWGCIWVLESLFEKRIANYLNFLYSNLVLRWIGIVIIFIGIIVFAISAYTMKTSWRVGIDKNIKTKLITEGIYRFSRNPAFLGFDTMFIGVFISFPNILTLIITLLNIFSINLLIIKEEQHLLEAFGEEYTTYKDKTRRYI